MDDNKLIVNIAARSDSKSFEKETDKSIKTALKRVTKMREDVSARANLARSFGGTGVDSRLNKELSKAMSTGGNFELDNELSRELVERWRVGNVDFRNLNDEDVFSAYGLNSQNSVAKSLDKANLANIKQTLNLYRQTLPVSENLRMSINLVNNELNKQVKLMREVSEGGSTSRLTSVASNVKELSTIKETLNAEKEQLKNIEKLKKETKDQGKELSENEKLLQHFNENFDVTGIVGIRAFRTIARYSTNLLKSLIELTIETQKIENGFSSLNNKVSTFNSRITDIKKNLGSSITSVLEPVLDILNVGIGYISSLTRGLAELPFPLKQILGLFTLFAIVLPSVISLFMILRYYGGKVVKTFLAQAAATNKAAAFMVNYRAVIASTLTYISLFIVLALSVYNLFKKTNKESEKAKKNLGLSSFDDVNALTENTAGEVENITEKTEKLFKVISGIVAALTAATLLMKIFGLSFGFAGFEKIKTFAQIFTNPILLAGVTAIAAVIAGVVLVIKKLIDGVKKLVTGWSQLSFLEKSVSIFLMVASAVWTLAGAIIAVKGALKGNWLQFGLGALVVGGGIGLGYGANAYLDSKLPAMAHGGVVSGPTVAMVGEGRYPEAVMPLGNSPEFADMKQDITNAVLAGLSMQGGRSNQPINITVNVDKDYIYKSYNQVAKQNGR